MVRGTSRPLQEEEEVAAVVMRPLLLGLAVMVEETVPVVAGRT